MKERGFIEKIVYEHKEESWGVRMAKSFNETYEKILKQGKCLARKETYSAYNSNIHG